MNIRIRRIKIVSSELNEIKLYKLQVKSTCTILETNHSMLLQYDVNVSFDRIKLMYGYLYLHDLNGNDKLSDNGIKKRLVYHRVFQMCNH